MEDLDRVTRRRPRSRQLADLRGIGHRLGRRGRPPVERFGRTRRPSTTARRRAGLRVLLHPPRDPRGRERAARRAPDGAYPGTCRDLTDAARGAQHAAGRAPGAAAAHRRRAVTVRRPPGRRSRGRGRRRRAAAQRRRAGIQPRRGGRRCRAGRDPGGPRRRPAVVDAAPVATAAAARPARRPRTPTCRWCSDRTDRAWRSGTARSRWTELAAAASRRRRLRSARREPRARHRRASR